MTTIYTKPQIDAMAVKIGGEIKAAKTTITQSQGQSTTYAVSQKMITDSLSAFGTAATKNVGTAAGQVPLVENTYMAALGSYIPSIAANTSFNFNDILQGTRVLVSVVGNLNAPPITGDTLVYVECIMTAAGPAAAMQKAYGYTTGAEFTRVKSDGTYQAWKRTLRTEADGGISLPYIQTGVAAPRTAQKLITATYVDSILVPHGLDTSKIISATAVVYTGTGEVIPSSYEDSGFAFRFFIGSTEAMAKTIAGLGDTYLVGGTLKILITYTV